MGDDVEVDEGEGVEIPAAKLIDEDKLEDEALARFAKMSANPDHRGKPELTYSGYIKALNEGKEAAMSAAIREAAYKYLDAAKANGIGPIAEKKLLAYKVVNGEFDG